MQKEKDNNNLQILREIQKKEKEEENIKNKKEEEAREIIKNMRINSTVIRNTSSSPLIFYQKRQNTNNTFEVMIYCSDERCSFIGIHNPQVNSNNRYINLQVIQNHFAIFNLLPGTYHVCSYSKESLENIGFVEVTIQPQM
ncbi:GRIP domain containing protein RUD3 [Entamoeba histolytica HM-3:IMSS]|nr:GRIP domain containing protein RUD3 [Entamoeba histolytica HM-3:IMSS]